MADANRRLHLLARFRQQNGRRQHPEIGQAVALIGLELIGLGDQSARAKRRAKCVQNLPVHNTASVEPRGPATAHLASTQMAFRLLPELSAIQSYRCR